MAVAGAGFGAASVTSGSFAAAAGSFATALVATMAEQAAVAAVATVAALTTVAALLTAAAMAAIAAVATVVKTRAKLVVTTATARAAAVVAAAIRCATAAVTGNSGGLTTHEGDCHQAEENGRSDSIETLHSEPPKKVWGNPTGHFERDMRSRSRHEFQTGPGRPPNRKNTTARRQCRHPRRQNLEQPAALPRKRCGLANFFHLGRLAKKANTGSFTVKQGCFGVLGGKCLKKRVVRPGR